MILPRMSDEAGYIAVGLLLTTAIGFILWGLRQRLRLKRLTDLLAETRLELTGANNRLEQAKNHAALLLNTDPITGLAARHVIVERFYFQLNHAQRHGTLFGIILIALTDFDRLSNQLGTEAGDQLLLAVGDRLTAAARETDTVGRMHENEFAVLLSHLQDVEALDIAASRLRTALNPPFTIPGTEQTFALTTHLGSASYPRDGTDWTSMLKLADRNLALNRTR